MIEEKQMLGIDVNNIIFSEDIFIFCKQEDDKDKDILILLFS